MIIDLILDRKDGIKYNPARFYNDVMSYENYLDSNYSISRALDQGTNYDVQRALCRYIIDNDYNLSILDYITAQDWLMEDK